MQSKHNKQLVPLEKQLRKEMTKKERHPWHDFLRTCPVRFPRQKVLEKYIADFYSAEARLVIELDGFIALRGHKYRERCTAHGLLGKLCIDSHSCP